MRWTRRYHSVALVGTDGSGKSTQAGLLRLLLAEGPRRARVFAVHPFGRKLLLVGTNSPILPVPADAGPLREKPRLLRRIVAAADILDIALYLWLVHARAALATLVDGREVWLVGDRSMDDILVKHWRQGTLSGRTAALIRGLVPRFEVTVWLRVEPRVAMARDNDFDPSYYEKLYAAYSAAAERFDWRVVPEQGRTPEGVHAGVVEELGLVATGPNGQGALRRKPV